VNLEQELYEMLQTLYVDVAINRGKASEWFERSKN
jgi:hypothetical protein